MEVHMDVGTLRRRSAVLIASLGLLAVACGGSSGGSSSSSASTPKPSSAPALVTTVSKTVAGKSQTILVGAKGLTLYYFTPDKGGTVTCTAACAQNWPPYTLPSGVTTPTGDKGVTGKLATVASPSGGMQITYNGWPLYYYVKDADGEDTYGQGVGGKWFVVTPDVASAT
jgi:predicted lipoprotein with Yx(FWY)xxD motif